MKSTIAVSAEMKLRYLQRKLEELEICQRQLEVRNYEPSKILAHQMKGNAASFEFPLLEELAKALELAAQNENSIQIELLLGDLHRAVCGHKNRLEKMETTKT